MDVVGDGPVADGLRERARARRLRARATAGATSRELVVDAAPAPASTRPRPGGAPLLRRCAPTASLAARGERGARAASTCCRRSSESQLVELTRAPGTPDAAAEAAEGFFARLGFHAEWVGDAPGLVLGRIVCQLVNEAAFAVGEGVGSAEDVDAGLTLGLNHPRGPVRVGRARSGSTTCSPSSTGSGRSATRSATGWRPRCAAQLLRRVRVKAHMKRAVVALALSTALLAGCTVPRPGGDGVLRYRDQVFSNVTVTNDLTYGSAIGRDGNPATLKLDLYQPTGDTVAKRPAMLWIHGGGFTTGDKSSGAGKATLSPSSATWSPRSTTGCCRRSVAAATPTRRRPA